MFKIFNKKSEDNEKEVEAKVENTSEPKKKKDISSLKEQKLQYREEKKKRQEANKIKREEEAKVREEQLKKEEAKRQEEFKKEQAKKQEEFKKRQEEAKKEEETKDVKKEYAKEEETFDLFGYEVIDLKQGMIIEGVIISDNKEEYVVEVNSSFKEVLFPKQEANGQLQVGDNVKALIYRHSNDDFYISQRRLQNAEIINQIKEMQKNKEVLKGKVLDFQNSNYIVELENGYQGLVYQVNIALEFIEDPKQQIGKEYEFVIKRVLTRGNYKFELSRIPLLKEHLKEKAELVKEDVIIPVKEFTKNKAGIEFDYEGFRVFIPYKLMAHNFVSQSDDLSSFVGKEAKIIECKPTKYGYNVVASIKVLEKDPFESFISNFSEGDIVEGKVLRKEPYGIFVEVSDGIKGLYHKNDFSSDLITKFDDIQLDDIVKVKIKTINIDKKQVDLQSIE